MPHPRFKHQWEEDSYWKHYEQHQEEIASRKEEQEREAQAEAEAEAKAKAEAEAAAKAEALQTIKGQSRQI